MYEELKLFPKTFNGDQESLQHGRSQSWYIGTLQASPGESWYIVHSAMYELSQCTNRIWYMAMYNVPYKHPCLYPISENPERLKLLETICYIVSAGTVVASSTTIHV